MKLYITDGSPYARIVRVVILEKGFGLEPRLPSFRTRSRHPTLSEWLDHIAENPSLAATAPAARR